MNWRELIEFRPPYQTAYFKGTNTRVLRLMLCLANGWTETQILMMHPEVSIEHIQACLNYGEACVDSETDPQIDPQLIDIVLRAKVASSLST
jgi:uncharacterized protein (DUF433 family)